jgi:ferredoxin-NADP reductase
MLEFTSETNIHHVFLADDIGLASLFPKLKERLAQPGYKHVTLVYYSSSDPQAFHPELGILQNHFPTQLFVLYCYKDRPGFREFRNEDIEAILNANTMQRMEFILSGMENFVARASGMLRLLGIQDWQIQEQYFTS